jgi:hypothetical protein
MLALMGQNSRPPMEDLLHTHGHPPVGDRLSIGHDLWSIELRSSGREIPSRSGICSFTMASF